MHTGTRRRVATIGCAAVLAAGCSTATEPVTTSTSPPTTAVSGSGSVAPTDTSAAPTTTRSSAGPAGTDATTTAVAEVTPVLAEVTTAPVPVTGTDGLVHLAYELYLTNITSTPVTVESVRAVDAGSAATVQTLSGTDLLSHARVVGTAPGGTPPTAVVLGGGQLAIVWLDPSVDGGSPVPTSLTHQVQLTFDSAPSPLIPAALTENVAATAVSDTPAPTIASPLDGPRWLDGNGCCDEVTPHRGAANPINGTFDFAERFAIDWVQLTPDLTLTSGPNTELSSYAYYGAPIHAVADGEIVAVYDELPDQVPGANPPEGSLTLAQYGGNHVVQRFEQNGRTYYALYAHLKPGSAEAAVSVGQTVRAGDVVGDLGNSGNTDSPHLHFHVMDGPDPLASDGLPYQFASLQLTGRGDGSAAIDPLFTGRALELAPDGPSGIRTDRMPMYLDLVDLTSAASSTAGSSTVGPSTAASSS